MVIRKVGCANVSGLYLSLGKVQWRTLVSSVGIKTHYVPQRAGISLLAEGLSASQRLYSMES
jgi:hypothetical protein